MHDVRGGAAVLLAEGQKLSKLARNAEYCQRAELRVGVDVVVYAECALKAALRFAYTQKVVRGDIVVVGRAAEKIKPAFAYSVFVVGEQSLRDAQPRCGFLLAYALFLSKCGQPRSYTCCHIDTPFNLYNLYNHYSRYPSIFNYTVQQNTRRIFGGNMKSYIIYIIRSGATREETEGKYIGHTDVELSEEGRKQLENMRSELVYPPVGAVISSPLKRCTDTAAILYPDNKCITIDSLIECNFGEFEGKDAEELKDYPMFPRWLAGEQGVEPPFGESNEAFARRVCEGFIKIVDGLIKTETDRAAIVTHGGVMMALADSVTGVTGASVGAVVVTVSLTMSFIRNARPGSRIRVKSHITHNGRTTIVIAAEMYDEDDKLMANILADMMIVDHFPEIPRKW